MTLKNYAIIALLAAIVTTTITTQDAFAENSEFPEELQINFSAKLGGVDSIRSVSVHANSIFNEGENNDVFFTIPKGQKALTVVTAEKTKIYKLSNEAKNKLDVFTSDDGFLEGIELSIFTKGQNAIHYKELNVEFEMNQKSQLEMKSPSNAYLKTFGNVNGESVEKKNIILSNIKLEVIDIHGNVMFSYPPPPPKEESKTALEVLNGSWNFDPINIQCGADKTELLDFPVRGFSISNSTDPVFVTLNSTENIQVTGELSEVDRTIGFEIPVQRLGFLVFGATIVDNTHLDVNYEASLFSDAALCVPSTGSFTAEKQ